MDNAAPPMSWVERAVVAMKQTDVWREQLDDEDYRTVPVPVWDSQRTWLVIGVGTARRAGGPWNPTTTKAPHLVCIIQWPKAAIRWIADDGAERAWPTQPGLPRPAFPTAFASKPRQATMQYYSALSTALEQGAFSAKTPPHPPAACAAASDVRAAFMTAAASEALAPYYATPLHNIDGWIAANCGKR